MSKTYLILAAILFSAFVASAHAQGTAKEHSACRADAKKFCTHTLKGGPFVVDACLAFNKSKLTAKCRAVLASHGM